MGGYSSSPSQVAGGRTLVELCAKMPKTPPSERDCTRIGRRRNRRVWRAVHPIHHPLNVGARDYRCLVGWLVGMDEWTDDDVCPRTNSSSAKCSATKANLLKNGSKSSIFRSFW